MDKLFFVQLGTGTDLHGQDVTVASVRAVENAIRNNSLPGIRSVLPDGDISKMKVNIRLAVPCDKDKLNVNKVKEVLPYGEISVEIVDGGMLTTSGVVLPDQADKNDQVYIVNAAVEVGY